MPEKDKAESDDIILQEHPAKRCFLDRRYECSKLCAAYSEKIEGCKIIGLFLQLVASQLPGVQIEM